jgi:diguanylate cyclase (GGDEF)-like protein
VSPASVCTSGERDDQQDDNGATGLVELVTSELNTRTGENDMQTSNDRAPAQYLDMDNAPATETAVPADDTGRDEPAISDLRAVADEFNAAFNTALYELEASRTLARERSARIEELNESIVSINTALQEEISTNQQKDEARTRESEALNQSIRDLESERERLRRYIVEQKKSINDQAGEISGLVSRVAELSRTLEQHESDSLRAHEAFALEREESNSALTELQEKYDTSRQQLKVLHEELEVRTNELAGFSAQVDTLANQVASLTEEGNRQAEAHREESNRLHTELQQLNEALRTKEELLQQSIQELEARNGEITSLNECTNELRDELEAQAGKMHEEAESHVRVCAELNDRMAGISSDYDSLKVIHDELVAHVEKLEHLNRALHDSSNSENEVHRKIIGEKDAAITALRARLEAMNRAQAVPAVVGDDDDESRAAPSDLQARLEEAESQARMLANRASIADDLEAQVVQLKRELQALRENGGTETVSLQAPAQIRETDSSQLTRDRDQFVSRLNTLLAGQDNTDAKHTLMYVLLDNFIRVRDEIGIMNSELVVNEIAGIIKSRCDENDVMTQFGDCTFVVLCSDTSTDDTREKAEQLRSTIENHIFEAAGSTLVTSTSIGICAIRGSDSDARQVISRADLACESARLSGGNQIVVNSAVSDELCVREGNTRHTEIVDRVLAENRIKIYYQPISNLKNNLINCFEVLTRVVDENSNIILPGEFFAMAVNSGKATLVDRHIIESVLKTLAESPDPDKKFFIKLTLQSVSSHDLPAWISDKLDAYNINPGQLVFEVAERIMDSELKSLSRLSMELVKIGCKIAIEHYRLETKPQHLRHIHPDYLKIDSGLVQNISKKGTNLAKVNEIMDLAKMNNLLTIAEGVESPACLTILWELGISFAQGYFISEPAGKANLDSFEVDSEPDTEVEGKATYTLG